MCMCDCTHFMNWFWKFSRWYCTAMICNFYCNRITSEWDKIGWSKWNANSNETTKRNEMHNLTQYLSISVAPFEHFTMKTTSARLNTNEIKTLLQIQLNWNSFFALCASFRANFHLDWYRNSLYKDEQKVFKHKIELHLYIQFL